MGSWSVYCEISRIAITSGNPCVILPLKKSRGLDYQNWQPATLPIFGTYNDYGGMEDIEIDDNTKLIEEHFGVTIDEFVEFLVDGQFSYDRDEAKETLSKINKVDNVEEMRFMWMDRQVYDYMTTYNDEWHKGYADYGTPEFMKLFGFKLDKKTKVKKGDNYDHERFDKVYRNGDVMFYSDGRLLLSPKARNGYVYHFGHGDESSLETYFDVPEELHYLKELGAHEMWRVTGEERFRAGYGFILGTRNAFNTDSIDSRIAKISGLKHTPDKSKLYQKYFYNLEKFGDKICGLVNWYFNLTPMSAEIKPYTLYLTPQCGEYNRHQEMLEKFAEINKGYCYEDAD